MADAFNNLSDAASSIIGFIGVRMAGKPADSDHPFGHGRIEYISAFIVAFLVIQVGVSLFKTSLGKVIHPEEVYFKWISVLILLISVGVKFWLSQFNKKLGSRINSKVMEATAADAMGDVMTTSAAILSLLALKYLKWNIDGVVGLAVSVAVMYGGLNIAKDTLAPLIGRFMRRYLILWKDMKEYWEPMTCSSIIMGRPIAWRPFMPKFQAIMTRNTPMRSLTGSSGMHQKNLT